MTSETFTLPPEWSEQDCVLLSWPHKDSDWGYMLDEVSDCFTQIAIAISRFAKLLIVAPDISIPAQALHGKIDSRLVAFVEMPTNDTWSRDFGFISLNSPDGRQRVLDFKFNGWGLKFASDKDNLITSRLLQAGILSSDVEYSNHLGFVLEGGSIEIDDEGTILTTAECLNSPNRNGNLTEKEIEKYLLTALGAKRMLWIRHGALQGDDTDSHIDTLARFLPRGIIAYSSCDRKDDSHYGELLQMEIELKSLSTNNGDPYHLIALPIPMPICDVDGHRLPATYANFLILNNAILLPIYGDLHYDEIAIDRLSTAMPDFEIVPVNCVPLIQQHGSLHCVTMQIPRNILRKFPTL